MLYRIRRSTLADTEILGQVHAQGWQETYPGLITDDVIATIGSVAARIERRREIFASSTPQSGHFVVENDSHKVVGFGDCGPAHITGAFAPAEINTLYLLRKAQKQGLGARLLKTMFAHLAAQGFDKVALKTLASNPNSNAFYQHMGGVKAGILQDRGWAEAVYVWSLPK